jgi:hypothetical protein
MIKSRKNERGALLELLGWLGVICILSAYTFLTLGLVTIHSPWYLLLNCGGSAIIILHSYLHKDYQPLVLNSIWLLVALIGLARIPLS